MHTVTERRYRPGLGIAPLSLGGSSLRTWQHRAVTSTRRRAASASAMGRPALYAAAAAYSEAFASASGWFRHAGAREQDDGLT